MLSWVRTQDEQGFHQILDARKCQSTGLKSKVCPDIFDRFWVIAHIAYFKIIFMTRPSEFDCRSLLSRWSDALFFWTHLRDRQDQDRRMGGGTRGWSNSEASLASVHAVGGQMASHGGAHCKQSCFRDEYDSEHEQASKKSDMRGPCDENQKPGCTQAAAHARAPDPCREFSTHACEGESKATSRR
jgi:hypothetical protein